MSRAVGQLEKMYNTMNWDFYGGTLPTPIITVQSKPGTWGHCSRAKVWKRKDGEAYEMNIAAESLNGEIEQGGYLCKELTTFPTFFPARVFWIAY